MPSRRTDKTRAKSTLHVCCGRASGQRLCWRHDRDRFERAQAAAEAQHGKGQFVAPILLHGDTHLLRSRHHPFRHKWHVCRRTNSQAILAAADAKPKAAAHAAIAIAANVQLAGIAQRGGVRAANGFAKAVFAAKGTNGQLAHLLVLACKLLLYWHLPKRRDRIARVARAVETQGLHPGREKAR